MGTASSLRNPKAVRLPGQGGSNTYAKRDQKRERAREARLRKDGRSLGYWCGSAARTAASTGSAAADGGYGAEDEAVIETSHNQSTIRLWLKH